MIISLCDLGRGLKFQFSITEFIHPLDLYLGMSGWYIPQFHVSIPSDGEILRKRQTNPSHDDLINPKFVVILNIVPIISPWKSAFIN